MSFKSTKSPWRRAAAAVAAFVAATGGVQQSIPVRSLTTPTASDSGSISAVSSVRALSDGRVFVNDVARRRLLLFDSALKAFTIVADTTGNGANRYGVNPGGLFAYVNDSSIFVDTDAQVLVVLDPGGRFTRVMSPPKAADIGLLVAPSAFGIPGIDPQGRLIYRARQRMSNRFAVPLDAASRATVEPRADSAPILRGDFESRTVDTLAMLRIPTQKIVPVRGRSGGYIPAPVFDPLPSADEWALLPDGTIAIVRVADYHIDWLHPDGSMTSSPRMPFAWKRLTREDKVRLIDSIKQVRADAAAKAAVPPPGILGPVTPSPFVTLDPDDLPDYYPSIRQGQVKADREGNIWILPSTSTIAMLGQAAAATPANSTTGLVFDVANRSGVVVERVRLPVGRNLVGFGPDGIVLLSYAVGRGDVRLERARVVR